MKYPSAVVMTIAGMTGIYLGVDYSGFVIAAGIFTMLF